MVEWPARVELESLEALLKPFSSGRPGLAMLVSHGEEVIFERYLGTADLEHGAPITSTTRFHVASVSKQFTAFAILQLARRGEVDLDADIHEHLPELADYGAKITLGDLVHHTSGLRDQWELLDLSGTPTDGLIRQGAIIAIAARQKGLNFPPGSDIRYSNTGYSLLAEVISRKVQMPFRQYMRENLFGPLGMRQTLVYDDVSDLLVGRAESYVVGDDSVVRRARLNYSNYGATSVQSTPRDLLKWARELLSPTVLSADLVASAATPGRFRDGRPHNYAFGMMRDQIGGLDVITHGGADAGYRAFFACFPSLDACVVVLSNGQADVAKLGLGLAEAFLGASSQTAVTPTPEALDACAGYYVNDWGPGMLLEVCDGAIQASVCGHGLGQAKFLPDGDFYFSSPSRRFRFGPDGSLAERQEVGGLELLHRRVDRVGWALQAVKALEGAYRSEELDVTYWLNVGPEGPVLASLRNPPIPLSPGGPDSFEGGGMRVDLVRDVKADVKGIAIATGRVRNLQFRRLNPG